MRPAVPPVRSTFADALGSEWAKLRTLPSTTYSVLATVVLGVGFAALYTGAAGEGYAELLPAQQAGFDAAFVSLHGGVLLSQLAIGVLGVLMVTSEYATGMIRSSLAAVPRRGRLLAAKAAVFTAVALVVGEVVGFGAFLTGRAVLAAGSVPGATLGELGVLRAVLATGPYLALIGLLGMAVGVVVRSTAGGITVLVVMTFLIPSIGQLAGDVIRYWPTVAGLQVLTVPSTPDGLAVWGGFGLLVISVAVLLAVAVATFRRRDA